MHDPAQLPQYGDSASWVTSILTQAPVEMTNAEITAGLNNVIDGFDGRGAHEYDDDAERFFLGLRTPSGHRVLVAVSENRSFQVAITDQRSPDQRDDVYTTVWDRLLEHIVIPVGMIEHVAKRTIFRWEAECNLNSAIRAAFSDGPLGEFLETDPLYELEFRALIAAPDHPDLRCRVECASNVATQEIDTGGFFDDEATIESGVARVGGFEGELQHILHAHIDDSRNLLLEHIVPTFVRPVHEQLEEMR